MNSYSNNSENINYKNISSDTPKSGSFVSEPLGYGGSHATPAPPLPSLPSMPPPLPPRPNSTVNDRYMNLMNRQTPINPYMNPSFAGMSAPFFNPYNTFGAFGLNGLNRFNNLQTNDDEFSRLAEDSSRHVFQSIESIVSAFSSVSMILESTYFAVYNSFRAIVGVVDHVSNVSNNLTQILSTLSILRTLRWILNRILRIVGLSRYINNESCDDSVSTDKAWTDANSLVNHLGMHFNSDGTLSSEGGNDITQHSSWPIIIFFSLVIGTPWLLWRIISKFNNPNKSVSNKWVNGEGEHYRAVTLHDFQSESPRELSFKAGQYLTIAPKDLQPRVRGWLLAANYSKKVGLIPVNYVRINSFLKSNENYQNK